MGRRINLGCKLVFATFLLIILCEIFVYYIVIWQCSWPKLGREHIDLSVEINREDSKEAVKALFVADIHLLCSKQSYMFDKLRREWQVTKAFQTAVSWLNPDVIFILGDVFEDSLKCNDNDFQYYVKKLKSMLHVPENNIFFVAGDQDVGFHYDITPQLHNRFVRELKSPSVQLVNLRGNYFVLINSMAMEGDGCFLCRPAQLELNKISRELKCAKGIGKCFFTNKIKQYSRPIVLQHFPMYRDSDRQCYEPDQAPEDVKKRGFQERWNCLSRESSEMIYDSLNPRVIFGGHTHHGCHVIHRDDIHEYTLPSFNWRIKKSPTFILGVFLPNNYNIKKCHIPEETTVIFLYCLGFFFILFYALLRLKQRHNIYKLHKKFQYC